MRTPKSKIAITIALLVAAAGCELVAGLGDHDFVPDTNGADGSPNVGDSSSGEAATGPAFTLTAPPSLTLLPGSSAPVTITITRENGFADAVNVTVSGLPAGATSTPLSFTSDTISGALTIALGATTTQSLSHLSIDGTTADGKISASAKMDLIVRGPAGSVDLLYGNQGVFSSTDVGALAGALDANGNLLLVGTSGVTGAFAAMRLLPNGSVDTTFGGGLVKMTFTPSPDFFRAVLPLATGSILYAGRLNPFMGPPSGTEYLRLTSVGTFDATYSPDGSIGYGGVGPTTRAISRFTADSSGRMIGVGEDYDGANYQVYIERRTASGALDTTFSNGLRPLGTTTSSSLGVAVQSDGKIVLGCTSHDTNGTGMALLRLLDTGAADSSFGVSGYVKPALITAGSGGEQIVVQPDGKILMLGVGTSTALLARYSATDGSFDSTFGSDGVASPPSASEKMALQSDGKIILMGQVGLTGDAGSYNVIQLERLTSGGAPDPTFGNGGFVQNFFGAPAAGGSLPFDIVIQPDGRIIVIGETLLSAGASETTIVRYWP